MGKKLKEEFEYFDQDDKIDQIWEWVTNSGRGMMRFTYGELPVECLDFCVDQFARFGVPLPPDLIEVVRCGASASFHYVDVVHPYALFRGVSDVDMTGDWSESTYVIHGVDESAPPREADPQWLETFRFVPGQCEQMFYEMLSRPGLHALPWGVGEEIDEILEGRGEEIWDATDAETDAALRAVCTPPGSTVPDQARMKQYFELAAWAGFIWLCGPLGRDYRRRSHDIIDVAMTYGECILLEGTILAPIYYKKEDRPPNSCHRCGNQVWCVEHTMVGASVALVCENCLHGSMPPLGNATCGTKFCKETRCPAHPLNHLGPQGIYTHVGRHGQLTTMARDGADLRLYGAPGAQLRLVDSPF